MSGRTKDAVHDTAAPAPQQQQYPSPTVHLQLDAETPMEQIQHLSEQTQAHMGSLQAMLMDVQQAHALQMQQMQAQVLQLQAQLNRLVTIQLASGISVQVPEE